MGDTAGSNGLTRIEKRAIEAQAVAPLMRALFAKIGRDATLAFLQEANEQEAYERGRIGKATCGAGERG